VNAQRQRRQRSGAADGFIVRRLAGEMYTGGIVAGTAAKTQAEITILQAGGGSVVAECADKCAGQ
jgi:hypothetical protein